jgi:hypothetical protein
MGGKGSGRTPGIPNPPSMRRPPPPPVIATDRLGHHATIVIINGKIVIERS